ncbi:flagellar biosynthesis protein FlhF [Paenibacillus gansuensis]|uniref:Flagellar biosynthesis protein FlhF n=1 Tax=Paenibacillus gansuensis TaxID=306542 RepID=A0ABW5PDL7_9BACL
MRVKKYIVDTMPEAMQKIRAELGKDAVILNTKEVRVGGVLGMFAKKKIEVIAATDAAAEEPARPKAKPSAAAQLEQALLQHAAAQASPAPAAQRETPLQEPGRPAASMPPAAAARAYAAGAPSAVPEDRHRPAPAPAPRSAGAPAASPASEAAVPLPMQAAKPLEASGAAPFVSQDERLYEELKQMKAMMKQLSLRQEGTKPTPEAVRELEKHLRSQDISEELLTHLMNVLDEASAGEDGELSKDRISMIVREELKNILYKEGRKPISPSTRVVHFVGPTGVGKTTTIAKLAAEQALKHNRKVGFITSDTYRIAAIDQLRTYATILNIPMEVVFSPQELNRAFMNLSDCDLIFMDTAGRNFRNEMYVSELNSLLRSEGENETFLVLSLTMKYRDMKAVTENFTKFSIDKVLFTKADETDSYGAAANLLYDFDLQLSYVTHGQTVPDDIRQADEASLLNGLLEGWRDE